MPIEHKRRSVRSAPARIVIPGAIARFAVALAAPRPDDVICDPCAGDCELLARAAEWVHADFPAMSRDEEEREHFRARMFHCFGAAQDASNASGEEALRTLGIEANNLSVEDALGQSGDAQSAGYSLVLTRSPFGGSREYAGTSKALLARVRTKRPELLMLARALELLRTGGRAVAILPESVLSGRTKAHVTVRSTLVESQRVEAVVALPGDAFLPEFDQPAAIVRFTRTDCGGTDRVWYCDLADGMSERASDPPLDEDRRPKSEPSAREERSDGAFSDALEHWRAFRSGAASELERARSAQSFCVSKAEIAAQGYDLGIRRYRILAPAKAETRRPHEILAELAGLEAEIFQGMKDLVGMLK